MLLYRWKLSFHVFFGWHVRKFGLLTYSTKLWNSPNLHFHWNSVENLWIKCRRRWICLFIVCVVNGLIHSHCEKAKIKRLVSILSVVFFLSVHFPFSSLTSYRCYRCFSLRFSAQLPIQTLKYYSLKIFFCVCFFSVISFGLSSLNSVVNCKRCNLGCRHF